MRNSKTFNIYDKLTGRCISVNNNEKQVRAFKNSYSTTSCKSFNELFAVIPYIGIGSKD